MCFSGFLSMLALVLEHATNADTGIRWVRHQLTSKGEIKSKAKGHGSNIFYALGWLSVH